MTDITEEPKSEIQRFLSGTNVFVTGATGFLGHVLIEKLLRTCYVNKLYILIRAKKNKEPLDRLKKMFSKSFFQLLLEQQPNFMEKVVLVTGDCAEPNMGLSTENEEFLVANTNVVFHCAATINLTGSLRRACFINVRSTRDLLLMAQRMPNLKSFVYVSTVFSNPHQSVIREVVYDCHIKGEFLISMAENLSESTINSITPQLLGEWTNTYTLSKAVAENLVKDYGKNMPICISRPCIVVYTRKEPLPGWASNFNSVPGLCLGIGLGAIHVVHCNFDKSATVMPADYVSNMVITSAWHVSKPKSNDLIPVFNYVPDHMSPPLSYGSCMSTILRLTDERKIRSVHQVWKPYVSFTDSDLVFNILFFLYHYIPAFFVDIYLWCTGKQMRAVKLYRKLAIMMKDMKFFAVKMYKFDDTHLQELIKSQSSMDKKLFYMDLSDMVWESYFLDSLLEVRRHILNEPDDRTMSNQKYKKIMMAYYTFKTVFYGFLLYLISLILKLVFY